MAVLEGGDYSEMKELSSGKNQRSQSTAGFSNVTMKCEYTSEIKMLIESMNNVKADVLNIKQTQLRKQQGHLRYKLLNQHFLA